MKIFPFLLLWIFLFLIGGKGFAQVGDVQSNIEKNKEKEKEQKSSQNSEGSGQSSGFLAEALAAAFGLIIEAQKATLRSRDRYPERVSLEVPISYGSDIEGNTGFLQAGGRGNWGLFATDLRYSTLNDNTGQLEMFDWMILILRIPIGPVKLEYGLGYVSVIGQDARFFKSTAGIDWKIENSKWNISAGYQWAEKTELGGRFNRNVYLRIDYEILAGGPFHLSPFVQYNHQNFFDQTEFNLVSLGIIGRLY